MDRQREREGEGWGGRDSDREPERESDAAKMNESNESMRRGDGFWSVCTAGLCMVEQHERLARGRHPSGQ